MQTQGLLWMGISVYDGLHKWYRAASLSVPMRHVDVRICTPIDPRFRDYKEWIDRRRGRTDWGFWGGCGCAFRAAQFFIQSLSLCVISSKAWFWCSFGQARMTHWDFIPSGLERRRYSSSLQRLQYFLSSLFNFSLLIKSSPSLLLLRHFPWRLYFLICFLVALVSLIPFHLFSSSSLSHFLHLPLRLDFHFLLPVHQLLSILTATWLPLSMLLKK